MQQLKIMNIWSACKMYWKILIGVWRTSCRDQQVFGIWIYYLLNIWVTRLGAMCASWFGSQRCFLPHVHRPVILYINTGHILLMHHLHQSHLVLSEELPILATPRWLNIFLFQGPGPGQAKPKPPQAEWSQDISWVPILSIAHMIRNVVRDAL